MSDNQVQRVLQSDRQAANPAADDDPLAELAKIVSGEIPTVAPTSPRVVAGVAPTNAPASAHEPVREPVALRAVENETMPVTPEPALEMPVTPEPDLETPVTPEPVLQSSPVVPPSPHDFQSENMDLESQLMAELGVGEPSMVPTPVAPQPLPPIAEAPVAAPELSAEMPVQTETTSQEAAARLPEAAVFEVTEVAMSETPAYEPAPQIVGEEPAVEIASTSISNDDFSDNFAEQLAGHKIETDPVVSVAEPMTGLDQPVEGEASPEPSQMAQATIPAYESKISDTGGESFDSQFANELDTEFSAESFAALGEDLSETAPVRGTATHLQADERSLDQRQNAHEAVPEFVAAVEPVAETQAAPQPDPIADFEAQMAADMAQIDLTSTENVSQPANDEVAPISEADFTADFSQAFGEELELDIATQPASSEMAPAPESAPVQADDLINGEFEASMQSVHQQDIDAQQAAYNLQVQQAAHNLQVQQAEQNLQVQQAESAAPQPSQPAPNMQAVDDSHMMAGDPLDQEARVILPPSRSRLGLKLAGGAVGLAIVAGIGVVGYGYVSGPGAVKEQALVRADTSDFKVKPEKPGGKKIANQDQPVYDSMTGKKDAKDTQNTLIAADVEPIKIASNEAATRSLKSTERLSTTDQPQVAEPGLAVMQPRKVKTVTVRADGSIITSSGTEIANLTAIAPSEDNAKNSPIDKAVNPKASITENIKKPAANNQPVAVPVKRVKTATRSLKKPAVVTPKPVKVATIKPVQPAASPTSANAEYAVQISSQRSQEAAQATFQNLKRRFASLLSSHSPEIKVAKVEGKGTFYRVRVPVGSRAAATDFCVRYKAAGGSCFVTR